MSTLRGSYFMTELLRAVAAATRSAGHSVELVFDEFPPTRDVDVYVIVPHEFRAWGNPCGFPSPQQRARTIALCTENLGTKWFEETYELLPELAAAVSINRSSAREIQKRGIRCEHLQLGYTPQWDTWLGDRNTVRPIDVLYLGAADPRRDPLIAGIGRDLWARDCQFLVPPLEPRTRPRPDFLRGTDKYNRLGSAKVLLNLHRASSAALEWMRFLETMSNGCVVVSEHCIDASPLIAGKHFLEAGAENIADTVNRLLDDPQRLRQLRERAYDFLRKDLPLAPAGERLAELAGELPLQVAAGTSRSLGASAPATTPPPLPTPARATLAPEATPTREPSHQAQAARGRAGRKRLVLLKRISGRVSNGSRRDLRVVARTPAYSDATPQVSVVSIIGHDHKAEGSEALASVATTWSTALEVLVLEDASRGQANVAGRRLLADHPSLPAMLLQQPIDLGLGGSRNSLVARARGQYVFILDGRGGVYPSTLQRLASALDADPGAVFAYPMVASVARDHPVELLSSLPWEPERLRSVSWIDAMALIRRDRLIELGGYSTDPRLAAWEHFDLWCRCAAIGGYGVHVPQVLAWRQQTDNAVPSEVWALMRARLPQLLGDPG